MITTLDLSLLTWESFPKRFRTKAEPNPVRSDVALAQSTTTQQPPAQQPPATAVRRIKVQEKTDRERTTTIEGIISDTFLAAFLDSALNEIIADVSKLLRIVPNEDLGILAPTKHAFETTIDLCLQTGSLISAPFPRGHVSSDGEGGIRIEWLDRQREIRLLVPYTAEEPPQIYYEQDAHYGLHDCRSGFVLARRLEWLVDQ